MQWCIYQLVGCFRSLPKSVFQAVLVLLAVFARQLYVHQIGYWRRLVFSECFLLIVLYPCTYHSYIFQEHTITEVHFIGTHCYLSCLILRLAPWRHILWSWKYRWLWAVTFPRKSKCTYCKQLYLRHWECRVRQTYKRRYQLMLNWTYILDYCNLLCMIIIFHFVLWLCIIYFKQ